MTAIDLTNVPLADNHCHGIYRIQALQTLRSAQGDKRGQQPGKAPVMLNTTLSC